MQTVPSKPRNGWRYLKWFRKFNDKRHMDVVRLYDQFPTLEPRPADLYRSLKLCPPNMVRVVTFATEPYRIYGPGTTDGIPYSAKENAPRKPVPLKNIHREYRDSLGFADPRYRSLAPWCENGVLMLYNSWLVEPDSEQKGRFTYDTEPLVHEIFHRVNDNNPGCVFMFLGTGREKWMPKVDTKKHAVLLTTSPANAGQGFDPNVTPFLGSGVFKEASKLLGVTTDMWRLR